MNVIIKMMDADNKGFRLLTVGEPVDVHVKAFDEASMTNPSITVNHGVSPLTKTYPLVGNTYIMNEAGDTISKIDFADVSKGMPKDNAKNLVTMAFQGAGLSLPLPLRTSEPDPEELDHGTILTKWADVNNQMGVYIDGYFKTPTDLTSVIIRRYKVYAKPDIIEELRKLGTFPEAKLAMLKANNDLVDPPLSTVTVKENGEIDITSDGEITVVTPKTQYPIWDKVMSHLSAKCACALTELASIWVIDKSAKVYACVNGTTSKFTRAIVAGEVIGAYHADTMYPSTAQAYDTQGLKQAWEEQNPAYEWFEFMPSGNARSIDLIEIQPSGDFNDLVANKAMPKPIEVI